MSVLSDPSSSSGDDGAPLPPLLVIRGHAEGRDRPATVGGPRDRRRTRPPIMVCVAPCQGMSSVLGRVASMARRSGAPWVAVTVRSRVLDHGEERCARMYEMLTRELGGEFTTVDGTEVAAALARHARAIGATEVVITHDQRWVHQGATGRALVRLLDDLDIHVLNVGDR